MFLLVPAHLGCPGQIPQSRKTVVCVCVINIVDKLLVLYLRIVIISFVVGLVMIQQRKLIC